MTHDHAAPPAARRSRRWIAGVAVGALVTAALGGGALAASAGPLAGAPLVAAVNAAPTNVALIGTPDASYTASWNNINKINDGTFVYSGDANTWGTWSGNRPASHWLEYTWPSNVTVDRTVIGFMSDGTGANGDNVRVPASWTLQYWDAASSSYKDVTGASTYGVVRGDKNEVTFNAVTTTKLRATLNALKGATNNNYSGVGVGEWEVWGTGGEEEPVIVDPNAPIDISPVDIPTNVGELPELPDSVTAIYEDGRTVSADVDWADVTQDQVAAKGTFSVAGTAEGVVDPVSATVYVRDGEPGDIVELDFVSIVTVAGTAPVLPETVTATYEDDSKDSRIAVEWAAVDPADYAEDGGLFFVAGDVEGTDLEAEATVFVVAADTAEDTTAPSVIISVNPGPATSGWFTSDVEVSVAANDNRDPSPAIEVKVGEGEWAAYTGPIVVDEDGVQTIAARATDDSGNVGEGSRELKVDATAPVTVESVNNLGSSVEITLTSSDDGSGVDKIQWEGPGTFWGTYTGAFTRALTDEEQIIEFAATDAAGNEEVRQQIVLPAIVDVSLDVQASPRCMAGKGYLAVTATNGEDVPVNITLTTPYGSKTLNAVAPGKAAYQSFNSRLTAFDAGTATVTATATLDGDEVTTSYEVDYSALDCRP